MVQVVKSIKKKSRKRMVTELTIIMTLLSFNVLRVWLENAYSRHFLVFLGIWPLRWDTISTSLTKVPSTGHSGSSDILLILVSIVVPEKLPGQKGVTKKQKKKKKKNMNFLGVFDVFLKQPRHDYLQLFWCLCVHSVEDSTVILIFDPFCFS